MLTKLNSTSAFYFYGYFNFYAAGTQRGRIVTPVE